jgi:hypothetical protein
VTVIILSYPNGQREEVLLTGVPRVGEHIRLATTDPADPSLVVEQVLWMEANAAAPSVIVAVRPHSR